MPYLTLTRVSTAVAGLTPAEGRWPGHSHAPIGSLRSLPECLTKAFPLDQGAFDPIEREKLVGELLREAFAVELDNPANELVIIGRDERVDLTCGHPLFPKNSRGLTLGTAGRGGERNPPTTAHQ